MFSSKRIRSAGFVIFSVFIVWHLIGISVVGPLYNRNPYSSLSNIYANYLSILRLNRAWPFYAPNPQLGIIMRYETVDALGKSQIHRLTEAFGRYQHAYARYSNVFVYLFEDPDYTRQRGFDKSVAGYLCRQHKNDDIKSINFIVLNQTEYTHLDYKQGKNPLDPEFIDRKVFGPYPCDGNIDKKVNAGSADK